MVLRLMKIFSLRVMARRTSFSLTNTCTSIADFAALSDFLGTPGTTAGDGIGGSRFFFVPADGAEQRSASDLFAFVAAPKKRSAISAAMDAELAGCLAVDGAAAGGVDVGTPLPRAIPCAASTVSTTRAIAARSTPLPADADADAANFFSGGFVSVDDGVSLDDGAIRGAATTGTSTFSCTASGTGEIAAPAIR